MTACWLHNCRHEVMEDGFLDYSDELDDEAFKTIIQFFEKKVDAFLKLQIDSDR